MKVRAVMLFVVLAQGPALAHEASLHRGKPTEGEVIAVLGDHMTLRARTGPIDVTLMEDTKLEEEGKDATRADLTPGTQVAVFGTKLPTGELVAHDIVLHGAQHGSPRGSPRKP